MCLPWFGLEEISDPSDQSVGVFNFPYHLHAAVLEKPGKPMNDSLTSALEPCIHPNAETGESAVGGEGFHLFGAGEADGGLVCDLAFGEDLHCQAR